MKYTEIVAVVVSYNGLHDTQETINALLHTVGHIHVVDNGSDEASIDILKSFSDNSNMSITYLDKNVGIGKALNIGVKIAEERNYKWMITMDQDSIAGANMIKAFCNAIDSDPSLVCLCPRINVYGKDLVFDTTRSASNISPVKYAITSGNLIKTELFETVGFYDEDLFIDCVDFDFSLRLRQNGFSIHLINDAILYHSLGAEFKIPKIFGWYYTSHSPLRRYYMYRNFLYMCKRYFFKFPSFIVKSIFIHFLLFITIPFYDEKPMSSVIYIKRGVTDFFKRKVGPYNNLQK